MKLNKKGFTLIELVVVMAIIAILSLLIIAAITAARRQSINTQRTGNVKTIETALETWSSKNGGRYPNSTEAATFDALVNKLVTDGMLTGVPSGLNTVSGASSGNTVYVYATDGTGSTYTLGACDQKGGTAAATAGANVITGCTAEATYVTTR